MVVEFGGARDKCSEAVAEDGALMVFLARRLYSLHSRCTMAMFCGGLEGEVAVDEEEFRGSLGDLADWGGKAPGHGELQEEEGKEEEKFGGLGGGMVGGAPNM